MKVCMKKLVSVCLLGVCLTTGLCLTSFAQNDNNIEETCRMLERSLITKQRARSFEKAYKDEKLKQYHEFVLDRDMFSHLDDCPVKDTPPPSPRK